MQLLELRECARLRADLSEVVPVAFLGRDARMACQRLCADEIKPVGNDGTGLFGAAEQVSPVKPQSRCRVVISVSAGIVRPSLLTPAAILQ